MTALDASIAFYGSVAYWLQELCPAVVAEFDFKGYNKLLDDLATALLVRADFPEKEGDPETETIQNLRTALAQLYPGSTCEVRRQGDDFTVAITVPGGAADTWPAQIPQPGAVYDMENEHPVHTWARWGQALDNDETPPCQRYPDFVADQLAKERP